MTFYIGFCSHGAFFRGVLNLEKIEGFDRSEMPYISRVEEM